MGKKFYVRNINAGNNEPQAPIILSISSANSTQITITWGLILLTTYYTVRRTTGNSPPIVVANNLVDNSNVISFTDTTVLPATTYTYTVSAVNSFGEGLKSQPASITTASSQVQTPSLTATVLSAQRIDVFISYVSPPPAATYTYFLGTSPTGPWTQQITTTATTTSYANLAASTTYYFRSYVTTNEIPSRQSADSIIISGTTQALSAKTFDPGHGVKDGENRPFQSGELNIAAGFNNFLFLDSGVGWGIVEPTVGNYDWSAVTALLNQCKAINRKLVINLGWKKFNTSIITGLMPTDMLNNPAYGSGGTGYIDSGTGFTAKMYLPSISNVYIAMTQAFAAQFDNDPALEFVYGSESAPSLSQPLPSDYTRGKLATELKRIYVAGAAAFVKTRYYAAINSLSGELSSMIETAYQAGCGFSTSDAVDTPGTIMFGGTQATGESAPVRNYRGLMPFYAIASQPVLGGKDNNGPPSNVINWAQTNNVTNLSWITYAISPNSISEIQTAITADPLLVL